MVHRPRPTEIVSSEKDPGGARVAYLVSEATSSFGTFVETQFIWNFRGYQWSSVGSSGWRCGNTLEVDRKQHQRNHHQEEEEKKKHLAELTTKLNSEIVTFGYEEQSKVIGAGSICKNVELGDDIV
ncbi:unnamed protein product [Caenorhabditis nigoni]|uniref:Uncharacterized protein n=1 Tax=Caenorhabditis nigoni TaxID=1611254 RepID=A0A2G5TPI6_9PELO|nr:hypothetical protein B9Z55_020835 [Caenorhabditis nigoni]